MTTFAGRYQNAILAIVWTIAVNGAMSAIAAVPEGDAVPEPASAAGLTNHGSKHNPMLIKYLSHIEEIALARKAVAFRAYQEGIKNHEQYCLILANQRDDIMARVSLLVKENNGKLPEGLPESFPPLVVGDSSDSAAIVGALLKIKAIDIDVVLVSLSDSGPICTEWKELLKGKLLEVQPNTETWRRLVILLYGAGDMRADYEKRLVKMAMEESNADALRSLLFQFDVKSGTFSPQISIGNLSLSYELCQVSRPVGVRSIACEYLLQIHDYRRAMDGIRSILAQRYVNSTHYTDEDIVLWGARQAVLTLLFYSAKNHDAFEIIYECAGVDSPPSADSPLLMTFGDNTSCSLAKGYLDQLERFGEKSIDH